MSEWTTANIPNLQGKTAIITGANSGIGFETARLLAKKSACIVIAVRSTEKGEAAAAKIRGEFAGADLDIMRLDLADLSSIADFAAQFRKKHSRLDLLINNAGVMIPPYTKTEDGFELQFGTNHLGHFALTGRLLDLILQTENARVVSVASLAHGQGNLNFDDLNWEKRPYQSWNAYGDSKLANLYFIYELQHRFAAHNVAAKAVAAHPGGTSTDLSRHSLLAGFFINMFGQSATNGALPTIRAATDITIKGGEYFGPGGLFEIWGDPVRVDSNELSKNQAIAERLWQVSEELTGVKFNFEQAN